jgi:hypothetical protein
MSWCACRTLEAAAPGASSLFLNNESSNLPAGELLFQRFESALTIIVFMVSKVG